MFQEVLIETIQRVLSIAIIVVPLLFLVEFLNHKYGKKLIGFFEKRKRFMPFWAALISLLPGCNAAAAVAVFYTKGMVSFGSLIAAMIATSDEAIYVFIPEGFNFLPLFAAKFFVAIFSGMIIDLAFQLRAKKMGQEKVEIGYCCSVHHHDHGHDLVGMFKHTAKHAVKIITFVFLVLFTFNFLKDFYGVNAFFEKIARTQNWQPVLAGIFGLIPGCGTSIIIATLYTHGVLGFGGALAGLSAASGDTLLVLLANKVGLKTIAILTSTIVLVSVMFGYLANLIL